MPGSTEGICIPWYAGRNANTTISRDSFEDDIKRREHNGISLKLTSLDDGDEEDCNAYPPQIVSELAPKLLANEVAARLLLGTGFRGESAFEGTKDLAGRLVWGYRIVFSIDTEGSFLVGVGGTHGDGNRVDRNVHHDDIEHKKTATEGGD